MIEIRELVIRATIDDSPRNNGNVGGRGEIADQSEKKDCFSDNIDLLLQLINDKKER